MIALLLFIVVLLKASIVVAISSKSLGSGGALPVNLGLLRKSKSFASTGRLFPSDSSQTNDVNNDGSSLNTVKSSIISIENNRHDEKCFWVYTIDSQDEDDDEEDNLAADAVTIFQRDLKSDVGEKEDADVFIDEEDSDDDKEEEEEGKEDDEGVSGNDDQAVVRTRKIKKRNKKLSSNGDGNGGADSDSTSESVDDIEEIDLDSDENIQRPSLDTKPIKAIWKTFLQAPPSLAEISALLGRTTGIFSVGEMEPPSNISRGVDGSMSGNVSATSRNSVINITTTNASYLALLKPNGTDKDSLYRQLLSQFLFPLEASGKRALWLDTEMALTFKGLAALSLYPPIAPNTVKDDQVAEIDDNQIHSSSEENPIVSQFSRAFRILSPQDQRVQLETQYGFSSNGFYWIHQMIVKALAHSIQANLLILNHRVLEKVEELVEKHFLEKEEGLHGKDELEAPKVTRATLLASLFEVLNSEEEVKSPTIIVFNDNLNWLLRDEESSEIVLEETRKSSLEVGSASKVMFVAIEPNNDSKALAQSLPPLESSVMDSEKSMGLSDVSPPSGLPGNIQMFAQGLPFPPGFQQTQIVARGFQVVIKNGTATVTPMPAMPIPPGFQGSPETFRKLMEQQQSTTNITLPTFSFPLFPSSMAEDDIEEYLRNPENQPKIKSVLDSLVGMVGQRLNQMLSSGQMVSHVDVQLPNGPALFPSSPTNYPNPSNPIFSSSFESSSLQPPPEAFSRLFKKAINVVSENRAKIKKASTSSSRSLSASGKILKNLFEDLVIEAPRDHHLKSLWEKFMLEEIEHRILIRNKRVFLQEMKKAKLIKTTSSSTDSAVSVSVMVQKILDGLEHILSKQIISRDQVREIIALALKFQAGRFSPMTMLTNGDVTTSSPIVSFRPVWPMTITAWSMDMALSSILKTPNPTIGRPAARSKESIANLSSDKYEKALIENVISPQDIGVTYDMIGGLEDVKEMMKQCITYPLKYPRLYQEGVANEAVKGLLLFGPPGTGKTMLAKAVATEGGATFMTVDASTIESKWLGDSEKNARAVFTLARKLAPCVIYLDEVDSVLASREHGDESSHGTLTSVKTTLMQEWDGLKTSKDR
jgi:hypothetical protein